MSLSRRTLPLLGGVLAALFTFAGAASAQAAVQFASPVDGQYINNPRQAVSYSGATAGDAITLNDSSGEIGSGTADGSGGGTIVPQQDIANAPGGALLELVDAATADQPSEVVHLDTVPDLSGPADGSTQQAPDVSFYVGNAIPNQAVVLEADGDPVATATADDTGVVDSLTPDTPLTAGRHTLTAVTVDSQGVDSTPAPPVTIDVEPAVPTFTALFDGAQLNQDQPNLVIGGVDPDATKVTLYDVEDVDGVGTATEIASSTDVASDGTATITPTLSDGRHSLIVSQTVGGVESDTNSDVTGVTVLTSAPTLDDPADGDLISDSSPWFSASGLLENGTENDTKAVLYIDGRQAGRDSNFGGGTTSFQPTNPLADGTHTAYVVTVDDLGHESATHSNTVTFTVDTTAPGKPVLVSPADGSTVTAAPTQVTARTEPGAKVHLLVDDSQDEGFQTADANGNATFTLSRAPAAGSHTLYVFAADAADNDSDLTVATFTVRAKVVTANPTPTNPTQPSAPAAPTSTKKPTHHQTKPSTPVRPKHIKLSSHTLTKKKPVKVHFKLSKPGTVKLTLSRVVKHRTKTVAKITVKVKKAKRGVYTLHTKVGKHTLAKGRYKLTLRTVHGKHQSKPVTIKLIVH